MSRISYSELKAFQDFTQREWESIPPEIQLTGTIKHLTEGEKMSLACLRASLTIWNKRGMLIPDWQSKVDLEDLTFSSEPMCD
jgi:hypothetical protein